MRLFLLPEVISWLDAEKHFPHAYSGIISQVKGASLVKRFGRRNKLQEVSTQFKAKYYCKGETKEFSFKMTTV